MVMAEALSAEVRTPGRDLAGLANVFARVARSVRLTIMLAARLAHEGLAGAAAADAARLAARAVSRSRAESDPEIESLLERAERPEGAERPDRERLDRERGEALLTLDETLSVIGEGLGFAVPIDLTAQNDDDAVPDLAALLGRRAASGGQSPHGSFAAVFDTQVRTLLAKTRPP